MIAYQDTWTEPSALVPTVEEVLRDRLSLHNWYATQHARPHGLRWLDWSHDNRVQIVVLCKVLRRLR